MIDLCEILTMAEKGGYCVPAFNVYNIETVRGVLNAAEELRSPVILQVYSRLVTNGEANDLAPAVHGAASRASVPVCFHLDHGAGEREVVRSLRLGMTGIMIDASAEPLEKNIELTRAAVRLCDHVGVPVEGELGHVGKTTDAETSEYTDPDEAALYVRETGIKALAAMVGTAHGRYKRLPVLDVERIRAIRKKTGVPVVLHGGSGVPDEQIRLAVQAGVRKMNFSTDLCLAFLDACRARDASIVGIDTFMQEPIRAVEEFVKSKIRVLGAEGRA